MVNFPDKDKIIKIINKLVSNRLLLNKAAKESQVQSLSILYQNTSWKIQNK